MRFESIERAADAFQRPVTRDHIRAVCRRVFGRDARSAVELGLGAYNSTYRITVEGEARPDGRAVRTGARRAPATCGRSTP